jgi:hypothetical protein
MVFQTMIYERSKHVRDVIFVIKLHIDIAFIRLQSKSLVAVIASNFRFNKYF